MAQLELITILIACYAALVATIGLGWNTYNIWRDRAKIKVRVSHGFLVYGPSLSEDLYIFIEAINKGRRPVTLTSVGFKLKNGHDIVFTKSRELPTELTEGKSYQEWISKEEIKKDCQKLKTSIKYAWFKDATGRIYKERYRLKDA
ncbi:unnamed protein product [marine sediment metagenome]|uniref:Uncharacterized protein n=1 Tax=marine sediment metagenome TaxID=412755 RepID=X1LII1_9ZZZZ